LDRGICQSALTIGVFSLLGLDLDSIGFTERFFYSRFNCAEIGLKLFSGVSLPRFVFIHAKGEGNPGIIDQRDVGRDRWNERNRRQSQE
jgi:hypothetical protein